MGPDPRLPGGGSLNPQTQNLSRPGWLVPFQKIEAELSYSFFIPQDLLRRLKGGYLIRTEEDDHFFQAALSKISSMTVSFLPLTNELEPVFESVVFAPLLLES
jgi:hypothetical protein